MDMLTVRSPEEALRINALKTLADITTYVSGNRFSLSGLAKGLDRMGDAVELQTELAWLKANGYLVTDVSSVYSVTMKGRMYEPQSDAEADGPYIEFSQRTEEPKSERRDPRDRRR